MNQEWKIEAPLLAQSLASEFRQGAIFDDQGRRLLTEELVTNLNALKIEIFSREHPPPHFRVSYSGETANFTIMNCTKLNGGLTKWERTIVKWHADHKQDLISAWNRTRPGDCPVGQYRE